MFLHKIDEVNFEGTIVKPRGGVYRCPYCKGDSRYPTPTWKTLKGFESHMKGCGGKPSAVEAKNQRNAEKEAQDAIRAEKQKELDAIAKDTSPIKIGDKVHLCDYYVSKPTHEQRGNRMMKVRYEEGRVYYRRTCEVIDIKALYAARPDLCVIEPNGAAIRAQIPHNQTIPGLRVWSEAKASVKV